MHLSNVNKSYRWFAVYVRARWEKKVYDELIRKGIDVYLPLKREKRQWSDRVKVIEEPLLRGYIFVHVSNKEYYDVLVTPGALRYVCFDGKATSIPECQIDDLKVFTQVANDSLIVTSEYISKGDQVKVCCGPLKDTYAEVVEIRGKSRLLLRFSSLGCCIHAELGNNKVSLVRPSNKSESKNIRTMRLTVR